MYIHVVEPATGLRHVDSEEALQYLSSVEVESLALTAESSKELPSSHLDSHCQRF